MPAVFVLDVTTDQLARRAVLRLSLAGGPFVAAHEVDLARHPAAFWHGLFDTRRHIRSLESVTAPSARLAELGRFLGEHVLGPEIARALADGQDSRTLLIRVPGDPEDRLAAAFARVPWEIAHASGDDRTLLSRNVVVCVAPLGAEPRREMSIAVGPSEPLRVLLVFADAPGQRPLAARLERERLLDLFFDEVMPARNVEVDVLCHGVTRRRLEAQVQARGGYHVVHWSGHGHVNALEIALDEGEQAPPQITGEELVRLFANAGGFIPPVVFLGACHSGSMVTVKDWESLRASLEEDSGMRQAGEPALDRVLEEQPGFTGTALALLRAGVKQVVAMRYEVGDTYARRLATRVYRAMFADRASHAVDAAVALGRGDLARDERRAGEYQAVDHATPVVFGSERVRLVPGNRRSAQVDRHVPRPQPLLPSWSRELDAPRGFVGRGEELRRLQREWLEGREKPIALIQGLAGLGKTSLAAEAVHLWFGRFDYVMAFQARGGPLGLEELYRRLDQRLVLASKAYRERCREDEMAKIYLAPGTERLEGAEREEALRNNLIDALGRERVLLVLDNFETNLLTKSRADGTYECADPAWERLFEALANRLLGTGSRVLVTSRHKPAALKENAVWMPLGPLPMSEAVLFFQGHPSLRELWYGDDAAKALARRILYVSRGHPLILGRIADLTRAYEDKVSGLSPAGRQAVGAALDKIAGEGYKALPDVFAGVKGEKDREQEWRYLEDVAVGAVDLLIERLSPQARKLLWVVTRAGEPATEDMIAHAWSGDSAETLQLRELAKIIASREQFPPEAHLDVDSLPEAIRAKLEALQSHPERASLTPLLGELCAAGLVAAQSEQGYVFHELVAERATAWMNLHPSQLGTTTEEAAWNSYGSWHSRAFTMLQSAGKHESALEAGRRGIRYLARAREFEPLSELASALVISTRDPALLESVIIDLQAAADEAPPGKARWSLRTSLADALDHANRLDQALPLFESAAQEAESANHFWDLTWICQNWAHCLRKAGALQRAREMFLRCAEFGRRSGRPRFQVVSAELDVLRIDVKWGRAEEVLRGIEEKLDEVRRWRTRRQAHQPVPEAPDDRALIRTLISALNIAQLANHALERWQVCLDLGCEIEELKRANGASEHELARTRFNMIFPLIRLRRFAEAEAMLEECLEVSRKTSDLPMEADALSALADIWNERGDPHHAVTIERKALAVRERFPDPGRRLGSHTNLANYLDAAGSVTESLYHRLAATTYSLVEGIQQREALRNLAWGIKQAVGRGEQFDLPRLADILASPAFATLRAFLEDRGVAAASLQAAIDDVVEQVRIAVAEPQWPAWAWLQDKLRSAGIDPASATELPTTDARNSWVILAKTSESLRQHFELADDALVLCAPSDTIQPADIARVEAIFRENPRVDQGFALVITPDPEAETRLASVLPDDRRYLFIRDKDFQGAADPQAFLHLVLREGLGHRRLFDMRFPASEGQFFGREKELEGLERDVLTGHCVGVFGLRKVGKTSLLRRLAAKFRGGAASIRQVLPIEADLLDTSISQPSLDGLANLIGRALDRELSRVQFMVPAAPSHPLERLRATVEHIQTRHRARVLLIIDEYEILLGGKRVPRGDGVELLNWLRGLAQEHPKGFGFVLAGRNQKLLAPARIDGADNPMYRFLRSIPIAGLAPDDCRRMVQKLGGYMGLRFEQEALDLFVEESGGHPALTRTLGDLVDVSVPTSERNPAIIDASTVKRMLPRFSREVRYDMEELVNAANDIDARAGDYLVHLAHGVPWIGGAPEARIDDALVGYGILHSETHTFRIGRLLAWLRENYACPTQAAHG